jgi:hypothetical protein
MDNGFRTLGECDHGTVWFVESEGKIVVNAYQAAMYFAVEDFKRFAQMIQGASAELGGAPKPPTPPTVDTSSKIRQFSPRSKD